MFNHHSDVSKCQGYWHTSYRCSKRTTCGKCARDHHYKNCTSNETRCTNCGLGHKAVYRGCQEYFHATCIQAICNREKVPLSRAEKILEKELNKLKEDEEDRQVREWLVEAGILNPEPANSSSIRSTNSPKTNHESTTNSIKDETSSPKVSSGHKSASSPQPHSKGNNSAKESPRLYSQVVNTTPIKLINKERIENQASTPC